MRCRLATSHVMVCEFRLTEGHRASAARFVLDVLTVFLKALLTTRELDASSTETFGRSAYKSHRRLHTDTGFDRLEWDI